MKSFFLGCVLLSLLLISCATQKKEVFDQAAPPSHPQIAGGNYEQALDYYIDAFEKYPDDTVLLENYIITVKKVKQAGDKAAEAEDFVLAEKVYSVLLKKYSHFKNIDKSLPFTKESLSNALKNCRINLSERQSRQFLNAGEFEKAINSYRTVYLQYADDSVLSTNLVNIIRDMKFLADVAMFKEDFLSTGIIYYALRKNYKYFNKFYDSIPLTKEFLDEGLNNCSLQLTKKGLEQYRKGNLAEAIAIWKDILKFDPDNQQIKKAIETATTQLKSLRKKENQV